MGKISEETKYEFLKEDMRIVISTINAWEALRELPLADGKCTTIGDLCDYWERLLGTDYDSPALDDTERAQFAERIVEFKDELRTYTDSEVYNEIYELA